LVRDSKTSRLLERRRENWRGVRIGPYGIEGEGACEGKMEMWRGLFWVWS
jgi:hypothetical protein